MEGVTHNENSNVLSEDGDQFPKGLRVLVVDDDVTCLHLLEKMLQHCSYQATKCQRGEDALSMIRERKGWFDIVLTDVHMPGIDGLQLLAEIANMGVTLPVVLFSSDAEKDTVLKGVNSGACDFLVKPIQISTLKILWQHVLRSNRRSSNNSIKGLETLHALTTSSSIDTRALAENEEEENSKSLKRSSEDEADHGQSQSPAKKPRMVWTPELNQMFIMAVNSLSNDDAKPKKILQIMRKMAGVPHLTRQNVSSHLQVRVLNSTSLRKINSKLGKQTYQCFNNSICSLNLQRDMLIKSRFLIVQKYRTSSKKIGEASDHQSAHSSLLDSPGFANLTHSAPPSSSLIGYQMGLQSQPIAPLQQPNPIQSCGRQQQMTESGQCRSYAHEPFVGFTSPMNNSTHPPHDQTYLVQDIFDDLGFWEDGAFLDSYIHDIGAM
ncbi:two-component response regulator ARR14-like isoform X1 [Rhodamnia argentea]|uniref:Two-component response regulator ARR14-like isoform X1 n=1 Tax=Rhodamnia argentea TaxID=178133 RepID=A0ABM3HUK0_9MYRT|nr:two-component response regulator ARR14-like isoform X1 [Rhodamnia argentea]